MDLKQAIAKKRLMQSGVTEEDIANIASLPIRNVKYEGKKRRAAVDMENNRVFILDDNDNYTGKYMTYTEDGMKLMQNKYFPSISVNQPGASDTESSSTNSPQREADEGPMNEQKGSAPRSKGQPASAQKKIEPKVLLCACGISLVAGILFTMLGVWVLGDGSGARADGPLAADQHFAAIQVVEDILPGSIITDDMLAKVVVTGDTYNQAALKEDTLYGWDDAPYIAGMYAKEYIAAGECLTHDTVIGVLDKPQNPFLDLEEGYAYLDIPVNLAYTFIDSVVIGRYMDLTLEVKTESNKTERVDTDDVPGLNHSSSITAQTVTDIYKFQDIVILDMIAADGTSLFDTIATYNAIPDGELQAYLTRYFEKQIDQNPDAAPEQWFKSFTIAMIRIKLPQEQVKAIGKLDAENTTVKIHDISDLYLVKTVQQQDYLLEARFTTKTLALVMDNAF